MEYRGVVLHRQVNEPDNDVVDADWGIVRDQTPGIPGRLIHATPAIAPVYCTRQLAQPRRFVAAGAQPVANP